MSETRVVPGAGEFIGGHLVQELLFPGELLGRFGRKERASQAPRASSRLSPIPEKRSELEPLATQVDRRARLSPLQVMRARPAGAGLALMTWAWTERLQ